MVVCDNTFASPYVVRPLDWGVDIVVSATKFIGGHNDALGEVIAMKSGYYHLTLWNKSDGIRWLNGDHLSLI